MKHEWMCIYVFQKDSTGSDDNMAKDESVDCLLNNPTIKFDKQSATRVIRSDQRRLNFLTASQRLANKTQVREMRKHPRDRKIP